MTVLTGTHTLNEKRISQTYIVLNNIKIKQEPMTIQVYDMMMG